jgi:microcin C transport system permease protein
MIPTLWAIITINFFVVQIAPGGPVDQALANLSGRNTGGMLERITGSGAGSEVAPQAPALTGTKENTSLYRGARGLDPQVVEAIKRQYGFDKPLLVRYFEMLKRYLLFDFGNSLFRGRSVVGLIVERMPVSISLGFWSTLIIYLVSIPLGIRKAVKHGSKFDLWTSTTMLIGNAIPSFLFAIVMIIFLAGGSYLKLFPLRGLVSNGFASLSLFGKVLDYFWHIALPTAAMVVGGFATLAMLTKNSFLDEINKQYVMTARAKGLTEKRILRRHVFRNAMLLVISGFPAAFIGILFTGALLIEPIFSLAGLGLLGYESTLQRDYPVMFGTLYMFTLLGLVLTLISDLTYTIVDPRIDFETRQT